MMSIVESMRVPVKEGVLHLINMSVGGLDASGPLFDVSEWRCLQWPGSTA